MNEKLKHTPGPWEKDHGGTIGHIKTLCNPEKHTKTVCKYKYDFCYSVLSESEIEANAKLIAAAPEMLECIIEIYVVFKKEKFETADILKLIIEKATGLKIEEVIK